MPLDPDTVAWVRAHNAALGDRLDPVLMGVRSFEEAVTELLGELLEELPGVTRYLLNKPNGPRVNEETVKLTEKESLVVDSSLKLARDLRVAAAKDEESVLKVVAEHKEALALLTPDAVEGVLELELLTYVNP